MDIIPVNVESLVDAGCGRGIVGALMRIYRNASRTVGLEIWEPYINFCKLYKLYDELCVIDLRKTPLPFGNKEFEVATFVETIEHLPRNAGEKLLAELERIAEIAIVSTPSHFFRNRAFDKNPYERHLSRWAVTDFRKRKYNVMGVEEHSIPMQNVPIPVQKLSSRIPQLFRFILASKNIPRKQLVNMRDFVLAKKLSSSRA